MSNKKRIVEVIDQKAAVFTALNDRLWDYAEIRFNLKQSADAICAVLEQEGFTIERGLAGMAHAFIASWGTGGPVIGVLGEYDALPGLSQVAGLTEKKPLRSDAQGIGHGHGCGHSALGAGAAAAAAGIKAYLVETGLPGTVRYYGCPAEESGSGKAYLARAGVFADLTAALTWHPMMENAVWTVSSLANYQIFFSFKGVSSHAAASPENGRSALDAAELMNVGVNYLREHIIPEARIHYAYTDVGGGLPNVVQASAELLYFIRAPKPAQVQAIFERVRDIAQGAALMTGTAMSLRWDSAAANYLVNNTLGRAMHANMSALGAVAWTEHDLAFARSFQATLDDATRKGIPAAVARFFPQAAAADIEAMAAKPILDDIVPYKETDRVLAGSTDVGDVSWQTPTAQVFTACYPQGTVAHSWQLTACGQSSLVHKGLMQAAKIIALTALDILEDPKLVAEAAAEHQRRLAGERYQCPIPPEVHPPREG
ncbi:MAG: amidohydrolase [Spirochaetaceae bacterium]|jgi:aminobenzoyl-glutamate utilization protein B|nr:amidohydrolase [Spirochaetaceae bacterium]